MEKKFFKVISPDKKLWYGTFDSKIEAERHMKKRYPKDEYKIIKIDNYGRQSE